MENGSGQGGPSASGSDFRPSRCPRYRGGEDDLDQKDKDDSDDDGETVMHDSRFKEHLLPFL